MSLKEIEERLPAQYGCEPWAAVDLSCSSCRVVWRGCQDESFCPRCGASVPYWQTQLKEAE